MENLILKIDEREFKAEFDYENEGIVNINGKPFRLEMLKKYEDNIYSFSVNQKLAQVEFEMGDHGNVLVSYEGLTYDIAVTNETRKMLEKYIKQSGDEAAAGENLIKAPMPGMIVKVLVKEGLPVTMNDKVIIVEAMKMENALASPVTGTVKEIRVKEGQPVEKGQVLIVIDTGKEI